MECGKCRHWETSDDLPRGFGACSNTDSFPGEVYDEEHECDIGEEGIRETEKGKERRLEEFGL